MWAQELSAKNHWFEKCAQKGAYCIVLTKTSPLHSGVFGLEKAQSRESKEPDSTELAVRRLSFLWYNSRPTIVQNANTYNNTTLTHNHAQNFPWGKRLCGSGIDSGAGQLIGFKVALLAQTLDRPAISTGRSIYYRDPSSR